jgi:glycosyltransferase involved in cell wall biosynthesis
LPLDKKIILAIGNLVEIKNHLFLIKVLSKVVDKRNDFLCIILGSGKLKKYLQNYIYKYELQNNIIMIEKQPHNEIPLWINSCDLFVLPSIKEGLPTVHIEAMACGKPVVATYNGGSEELVTSDQYGYLVKQGDIDDFADKILKGLENSWDEDNIALYSKKYELGNIAQQYISLYGSII